MSQGTPAPPSLHCPTPSVLLSLDSRSRWERSRGPDACPGVCLSLVVSSVHRERAAEQTPPWCGAGPGSLVVQSAGEVSVYLVYPDVDVARHVFASSG